MNAASLRQPDTARATRGAYASGGPCVQERPAKGASTADARRGARSCFLADWRKKSTIRLYMGRWEGIAL